MVDIHSIIERDRKRPPVPSGTSEKILLMIYESIGADGILVVPADDIYTDAAKYRIVLPSGLAIPVMFSGLEILQNNGEYLRHLVNARVNEAFAKLVTPING